MKKVVFAMMTLVLTLGLSIGLSSCGDGGGENGEVYVYNFGDYIDETLISEFEDETGIKVVYDTYDTNEEMYPVIKNESANYDVICPSDYMIEKMAGEGLLAEIDYDNVPNIKNIGEKYLEIAETYDPGNKYSVPHVWGTMGIMYNTKEIPKGSITSWNDLWNKKYSGQIVMPDSMRDTMAIALKAKGYSINTKSESEIKEATDYLMEQKALVYKYANDSARDLLIGGSANIGVVWNGEALYSTEENPDLEFVVPSEGSEEFIDGWAIPKNAKNKENAEKWINFMCKESSATKNFEYLTYTIPNQATIDKLTDDVKNNKAVFPDDETLKNCESLKNLGAETDDLYTKYWKKFKAQ